MSDEERAEQGQVSKWRKPRATLEGLGDITISGRFAINLRILLEPIGFLHIILIVLTLFAFSLTAGFSNNGSSNQSSCQGMNTTTQYTVTLTFSYPYRASSFGFIYNPSTARGNATECTTVLEMKPFSGSAEYYVFMSSVSFVYGILALVVYVLFYVPRYDITKYISIVDFIIIIVLAFFYILADIAWTAGSYQLKSYLSDLLSGRQNLCLSCNSTTVQLNTQSFVQTNFSLLFGWVATLVLIASIWFAYKDTILHLDRMGPLYKMSFYQVKRGQQYSESSPPQREGVASHKEEEEEEEEEERPRESGRSGWDSARGWDDETTPTDEENKW